VRPTKPKSGDHATLVRQAREKAVKPHVRALRGPLLFETPGTEYRVAQVEWTLEMPRTIRSSPGPRGTASSCSRTAFG